MENNKNKQLGSELKAALILEKKDVTVLDGIVKRKRVHKIVLKRVHH